MNRLDIAKTIANLEQYAEKLNEEIPNINSNNDLSNRISSYTKRARAVTPNQKDGKIYQPKTILETVRLRTSKQLVTLIS